MSRKIPFRVSAKTARLIGRENVAKADGAISELVKNTYDADASSCFICFKNKYSEVPPEIPREEYLRIIQKNQKLEEVFVCKGGACQIVERVDPALREVAESEILKSMQLWIADDGCGMSAEAIESQWMVIGTNFKEENVFSEKGRARAGAKGIGRFALDRLGGKCDLYSRSNVKPLDPVKQTDQAISTIDWSINWSDFDVTGAVLDEVSASLNDLSSAYEGQLLELKKVLMARANGAELGVDLADLRHFFSSRVGTIIKIDNLRDDWDLDDVQKLRGMLEVMIPPGDQRKFSIYLLDERDNESDVKVSSDVVDDFDYRIHAAIDGEWINFEIERNELEAGLLPKNLFDRDDMKNFPFRENDFIKKVVSYRKNIEEIFPRAEERFVSRVSELGKFDMTLRFFKRSLPSKDDQEKYPYRNYVPTNRRRWLEQFGGVKIYRDHFNVRPYGEQNGRSFDWLGLGSRRAANPAQASRKSWTVAPQNIAGTIHISRHENSVLEDQSNREGIIDNRYFEIFRSIVLRVVQEFEKDRSHIHYNLAQLFKDSNQEVQAVERGAKIARRLQSKPETATNQDALELTKAVAAQGAQIDDLLENQVLLRSLATLGTVLVSFSHEMGQLQNSMGNRTKQLESAIKKLIPEPKLKGVRSELNPISMLEQFSDEDKKIKQWFSFALSSVRPERRRRKIIDLREHLQQVKRNWRGFLGPREISLNIGVPKDFSAQILAFEIDLDSIFNNLILNSCEAFIDDCSGIERVIDIDVQKLSEREVLIQYRDNGPGLSLKISNPHSIFDFAVTTKIDSTGQQTGTGVGMWILGAVVSDFGGSYRVYRPADGRGFRLDIRLPVGSERR
ncbi:ATP-binding protein [Thalassospira lucentensis]|uniref:ATP-binding protein n=1 Tax=Thalassospira lucentensis TaxID=168935 RepID=UPI00399D60C7